ncbi:hypothetical protein VNO78_02692 [Psophocarpus tetragonolobus]|uniref:Protein CHUP1, chloroplastic n=1 Tax=Psophocarpus tetragonolobus TaxID=3891 RepID=A0AAN9SZT1_PSOTE
MIIKVSFLLVASVAAFKISHTKATKRNGKVKCSGSDGSHLEQEFEVRENSTANANHVTQNEEKEIKIEVPQNLLTGEFKDLEVLVGGEKMNNVTKREVLQKLVQSSKQREVNLERKLLELNGLREEQLVIAQMKKQLEEKTEKLDFLEKTIASLHSEREVIQEKTREGLMSKKQLDIAKKMINEMQRKKDVMVNAKPIREHILMLQQQVTEFGKYNSSDENVMGNKKLKDVQNMEVEVLKLKRKNKELELEKREMGIKLATVQARIITEEEIGAQIKQEITDLHNVHEELLEQVERLQRNRFDMVEEVVYQRWLYTLLKFEVQDHKKQSRKALRRDRSQNSSKEFHANMLASTTSDVELESVSSNATLDESDEIETTTFESSSSSQSSSSSMKMKKDWSNKISSKGRNFLSKPGLIHRFSMPMVASDVSESCGDANSSIINLSPNVNSTSKSLESTTTPQKKRVSFSDSVKLSTYKDIPEILNNAKDDQKTRSGHIVELVSNVVSSTNIGSIEENEGAKKNKIGHSDEVCSRNDHVSRKHDRIKIMHLLAFLFFLLILLACLMIK